METLVRELEELSFRTLPATEQERYDRWVLRWSEGGPRRSNSVSAVGSSARPLEEKVAYCENWFAERGAPCVFRLTPLADDELTAILVDRSYLASSPTDVMTVEIDAPDRSADVDTSNVPTAEWLQIVTGQDAASTDARRLAKQLTAGDGHRRFASMLDAKGVVVATGLSVDLDRYTTIYNMVTSEGLRRRGIARAIVNTLLALGRESGSTHGVLQVTQDNVAAQTLYRDIGFRPVYHYSYMSPPSPISLSS